MMECLAPVPISPRLSAPAGPAAGPASCSKNGPRTAAGSGWCSRPASPISLVVDWSEECGDGEYEGQQGPPVNTGE
ncbi:unnamed protein product [Boreogadus saida]